MRQFTIIGDLYLAWSFTFTHISQSRHPSTTIPFQMKLPKLKLPTRGQFIFGSSTLGIGLGLYRDRYLSNLAREAHSKEAEKLAMQTADVSDLPRKVYVYIAADAKDPNDVNVYRMRKYFATYIKVH
jgi:hypothetical protein